MSKKTTLAVPVALAAALPRHLADFLATTLEHINHPATDEESLWRASDAGEQMELAGRLIAGAANRELRTRVRNLAHELRVRGKNRRSFEFSIAVLEAFEALPDTAAINSLATLSFTAIRQTLPWGADERAAFASGEEVRGLTLEAAREMSSREIQEQQREWMLTQNDRVQALEREKARLQTELDTANNQKAQMARASAALQLDSDLPRFALTVRQEFLAITEAMSFGLENLEAVAAENLFREVQHPEVFRWQPAAAGTAYFALGGMVARAQRLMQRMAETYPDQCAQLTLDMQLEPAECVRLMEARAQLMAQAEAAARQREVDRANNAPGRRGRKLKG